MVVAIGSMVLQICCMNQKPYGKIGAFLGKNRVHIARLLQYQKLFLP